MVQYEALNTAFLGKVSICLVSSNQAVDEPNTFPLCLTMQFSLLFQKDKVVRMWYATKLAES